MNTKEKAVTLRQVPQGVIATVDEPIEGLVLYSTLTNAIGEPFTNEQVYYAKGLKDIKSIIASTFEVGKELKWERGGLIQDVSNLHDRFIEYVKDQPYDYTETDNSIIIKL